MKDLNKKVKEKFENFFDWIKGAELVELKSCNPTEDPIRPELNNDFRTSYGRKIYGVKYKNEICNNVLRFYKWDTEICKWIRFNDKRHTYKVLEEIKKLVK